jgi:hypothetical protein
MTIYEKMNITLSGWVITKVGMIDRYRYLVIAQWDNEDNKNPFVREDGKKYNHPTMMSCIDLTDDTIWWMISYSGWSHGYCDGGIIKGNKEAFFGSYNGVTYHLDYGADKFEHEELMMTSKHVEKGTARGIDAIRLIGNHFYTGDAGNEIHRRDAAKEWTLISQEPKEYAKKFRNSDIKSLDGYSETEIYFCGNEGNLWYYDGKNWEKIFDMPSEINFKYILCSDDGKVYAIDSHGRGVAVGRKDKFTYIPMKKDDIANGGITFDATHYKGKIYLARYSMYEFREDHWVKANIPGVYGGVEHLASKDGMLFIGTPYSLKIYNGKETFTLYGEAKDDARLVTKALIETSTDFLKKGHELLDEMDKQRK